MGQIRYYPAHKKAELNENYKVRIRKVKEDNFQEIPVYSVLVDMHEVRRASMAYFDFEGEIEVEISGPWYIYQADIRPLSKEISYRCDTKKVCFFLKEAANLSIELNKDRYQNLHLFAGKITENDPGKTNENTIVIQGNMERITSFGSEVIEELENIQGKRVLYIEPGMYYIRESVIRLPSNTLVYLAGGAHIIGGFICTGVENVSIVGKGIICQKEFNRFSGINGIRLSHARNITIQDVILVNPPHYSVYIGGCDGVTIQNIKSFSCEGWSDGIDIMSSQNVLITNVFLRNSDDCIAIYGSRWKYKGDSRNIKVTNSVLWADVAHPTNIGTHGNYHLDGDIIENIVFEDIDILEHNEHQAEYLGCLTINAGDKNTVRQVFYKNIRIEPFLRGKVIDIQIKCNPDYNPAPGKRIEQIHFDNIKYTGKEEVPSVIKGWSEEFLVSSVTIKDYYRSGQKVQSFEEANIELGKYTLESKLY